MKTHLLICAALCAVTLNACAQSVGQWGVQTYTASGLRTKWVTPQNNKTFGLDGSGNLTMVAGGGAETLAALSDVALTGLSDGHVFTYHAATSKWINAAPTVPAHNQAWSTITSTPTTLAGYGIADSLTAAAAAAAYAPLSHTQAISTVTGLQAALDAKAATSHTQAWSTITSTPTTLAGYGIADAITAATAASTYEPVQTAVSQAEAEAGTETAVRKWSPLRVKQAITALGGGGGAAIVRSSAVLQGYTVPPVAAEPPPSVSITFDTFTSHTPGTVTVTMNGTGLTVYFGDSDPSASPWVDTTALTSGDELATALAGEINTAFSGIGGYGNSAGASVTAANPGTGASATLSLSISFVDVIASSGGGMGVDFIPGTGHISEVTIIAQDGSETVKPLRFGVTGAGVSAAVQFCLKVGGTYYPVAESVPSDTLNSEPAVSTYFAEMISGRASASLVARMTTSVPTGGSLTCWGIVQQN